MVTSPLTGKVRKKQTIKITVNPINYIGKEWNSKEGFYCVLNMSKHYFGCKNIDKRKYVGSFEHRCDLKAILDFTGFKA